MAAVAVGSAKIPGGQKIIWTFIDCVIGCEVEAVTASWGEGR